MHIFSRFAKILGDINFHTGDSPKGVKSTDGERKKERLNDGNNNGQATHGARKHAWCTQAAWANEQINWKIPNFLGIILFSHLWWRTEAIVFTDFFLLFWSERLACSTHGAGRKHSWPLFSLTFFFFFFLSWFRRMY